MLFRANQMPPVLTNNSAMMTGQTMNQNSNSTINPMAMANHFPVSQDVDLRMGKLIHKKREKEFKAKLIHHFFKCTDPRLNRSMDIDLRSVGNSNMMEPPFIRQPANQARPMPVAAPFQADPRQRADPRMKPQQTSQPPPPQPSSSASNRVPNVPTGIPNDASDNEKAQLIMQVLQLSDEQIAMLSPDQRASIMVLKEQIAKSTPR